MKLFLNTKLWVSLNVRASVLDTITIFPLFGHPHFGFLVSLVLTPFSRMDFAWVFHVVLHFEVKESHAVVTVRRLALLCEYNWRPDGNTIVVAVSHI